jgi:hypothetical protein
MFNIIAETRIGGDELMRCNTYMLEAQTQTSQLGRSIYVEVVEVVGADVPEPGAMNGTTTLPDVSQHPYPLELLSAQTAPLVYTEGSHKVHCPRRISITALVLSKASWRNSTW